VRRYGLAMTARLLPGAELVEKGLGDLAAGTPTTEASSSRSERPVYEALASMYQSPFDRPEERLYLLLARDDPNGAHGRYNALVRRLVSFERAAESAS
jgi:hypothetical protein